MTLATVEKIETSNNWYYESCPKCAKKVQQQLNENKCSDCEATFEKAMPR